LRWLIFFLLISMVPVLTAASVVEEKEFYLEEEAQEKLVIEGHQKGEIKVVGKDIDLIIVSGYLQVYGENQAEIRQFYEGVSIETLREGDKIILEISRPDLISPGMDHEIFLEIQVPKEINLDIKTGSGKIVIRDLSGEIFLEGSGAFLDLRGGTGNIQARGLLGGHIEDFAGGEISLSSQEEVKLVNVEGEIQQEKVSDQ